MADGSRRCASPAAATSPPYTTAARWKATPSANGSFNGNERTDTGMPIARIRDLDVYYEISGAELGNPVLCIHGLGSSTLDWEHQIAALAKQHTVITYDVRGHGRSGKPRGRYSVRQFAEDATALIEHLEPGPVNVLGISMGGMIALQLAADSPHLVRSLVIVNSGPEMVLRTWKQRIAIYQRFVIVRLMGMRKMGQVLATALLPKPEHAAE